MTKTRTSRIPRKFQWEGKTYHLGTLARMHGKTLQCVGYRMDEKGLSLQEALTTPTRRAPPRLVEVTAFERLDGEVSRPGEIPRRFAWNGKELTCAELARAAPITISGQALWGRLTIGWTLKDAMTIPVKQTRRSA